MSGILEGELHGGLIRTDHFHLPFFEYRVPSSAEEGNGFDGIVFVADLTDRPARFIG